MKKISIFIVLFLFVSILPVAANDLRENEIINIGVIVNRDNSVEIITSTTEELFFGKSAVRIYADGDTPDEVLPIESFGIRGNTDHINWYDAGEKLKPGRYFAVVGDEISADWGVARAYFTIPAIEQWWTPQPTATPAPTPTEEPTPDKTPKPTTKATPVKTGTPAPAASSLGSSSVHIAAYIVLGAIICAETIVIVYLLRRKK